MVLTTLRNQMADKSAVHPFPNVTRILVCGDRNWTDEGVIGKVLSLVSPDTTIIHGACKGADIVAGRIARELDLEVKEYPARWDIYGYAAGPIRNRFMVEDADPELILVFHDDLKSSKGSKDMANLGKMMGIPVILFTTDSYKESEDSE